MVYILGQLFFHLSFICGYRSCYCYCVSYFRYMNCHRYVSLHYMSYHRYTSYCRCMMMNCYYMNYCASCYCYVKSLMICY